MVERVQNFRQQFGNFEWFDSHKGKEKGDIFEYCIEVQHNNNRNTKKNVDTKGKKKRRILTFGIMTELGNL